MKIRPEELKEKWHKIKDSFNDSKGIQWRQIIGGEGVKAGVLFTPRREYGLILFSSTKHQFKAKYKNISVQQVKADKSYQTILLLNDETLLPYFEILCSQCFSELDGKKEEDGPKILEKQLATWSNLLKHGRRDLTVEEERGLFVELEVLKKAITFFGASIAVNAWSGPLEKSQDFQFDSFFVEVKAKQAISTEIVISSFKQFDSDRPIYLLVAPIKEGEIGMTVQDKVQELRKFLNATDASVLPLFEEKLSFVGYEENLDKVGSENKYEIQELIWYDANMDEFPAIRASQLPDGISSGCYRILYQSLRRFRVEGPF